MAFCTNCGETLEPNVSFCTKCGAKVEAPEASVEAPASNASTESAASVAPVATPAAAPQSAAQQPYAQAAYQQPVAQPTPSVRNALLDVWKTDVAMTIVGIAGVILISLIVSLISNSYVFSLLVTIASFVYAIVFYPSYFSENPKITDPKLVSLLNGAAGGIIFGCLWNASLTNRKKGVSYIVFLILAGLSILFYIPSMLL